MKRTNIEGNDVTDTPLTHDGSDRVELSGVEYDTMIARLDMASAGIAKLTDIIDKIRVQIQEENEAKKRGIITLNEAGGMAIPLNREQRRRMN